MDYFENLIKKSYENLEKLDIRQLEIELNNYHLSLQLESYENSIIMEKIMFINYLIKEKKNK